MQSLPRIAHELFAVPLEPYRYLVYAPESGAAFVASARLVNQIAGARRGTNDPEASLDPTLLRLLESLGVTQPDDEQGSAVAATAVELRLNDHGDVMTEDVARRALNYVVETTSGSGAARGRVRYAGMEGCAEAWRVLEDSLAHARTRLGPDTQRLEATVVVTGVLDEVEVGRAAACLDAVEIWRDVLPAVEPGPPPPPADRFPADWLEMLRRLNEAGCRSRLTLPVTLGQLRGLTESVHYLCRVGGFEIIALAPVFISHDWNGTPEPAIAALLEACRSAQRALAPLHCRLGMAGTEPGRAKNFCGVPVQQLTILPDGAVLDCCSASSSRVSPSHPLESIVVGRLRTIEDRSYCRGCFARHDCAGPCYGDAVRSEAATPFRGSQRCHLIRELLKDRILARVARNGGISWRHSASSDDRDD